MIIEIKLTQIDSINIVAVLATNYMTPPNCRYKQFVPWYIRIQSLVLMVDSVRLTALGFSVQSQISQLSATNRCYHKAISKVMNGRSDWRIVELMSNSR
ncbi:hypothetical protein BLOT_000343 [Blomia tropicalis]|nr:hypothetical protein BLOT_000343 [Blomia tropicalis]